MPLHRFWRAASACLFLLAVALLPAFARGDEPPASSDPPKPAPTPAKPAKPGNKVAAKPGPKPILLERVVAVVNEAVILESELYQRAAPEMAELEGIQDPREKQRQFKLRLRQILDDMIDEELIVQAAGEAELEVSAEEIDKAIAEVKKTNKLTDRQLEDALAMQGYTLAAYRRDVRKQILRLRAINVLVRPRVSVTDEEVREKYEQMSRRSGAVVEVRLAHILVAVPEGAPADVRDAARRRAGELVERARAGEKFGDLALAASDDESTKKAGGELGRFKRGELPTEWEEPLFTADVGDLRGPLPGPNGFHIFVVLDNKKDMIKSFDDAKTELRNELYVEEMEKQTKVWVQELRKKAHIEVKL
jgi:parvulin-like peptidyl-prolyl isomerase